ncbi:hypothetical protein [Planktomarina sp.]|uniref:hypothetical protein n=1 Tax=Planktomarina sp. TaxID=2024851 RepID=UPI003261404C
MGLKLSDVSPAASLLSGEGLIKHAGIIPHLLTKRQDKKRDAKAIKGKTRGRFV